MLSSQIHREGCKECLTPLQSMDIIYQYCSKAPGPAEVGTSEELSLPYKL